MSQSFRLIITEMTTGFNYVYNLIMLKIIVNIFYYPVNELKQFLLQNSSLYIPINGGSSLKNDEWCRQNLLFDDSIEDNISIHNKLLNENTSIYWFWKNLSNFKDVDYVGFNHYRRFFPLYELYDYKQYDIVVAQPIKCIYSLEWQYGYYHNIDDLHVCIQLLKKYNLFFGQQFEKYMQIQCDNFAPMNMFIMKKTLFEEWCNFIFPILFSLEKIINLEGRDNYQKRVICFLEERIFGFWCQNKMKNGYKTKQVNVDEHLNWKDNNLNERGTYG